jgi:hydantoinase/carbamoylase family amidase
MQNLQINAQRLWDTLMETAQIGRTPKGGIKRLTLTDEDKKVRDWFKSAAEAIGCTVTIDEVGNMFARRPGRIPDLPPLCMGSHLDTQPTGGKFDGTLGVLGALEAMRTLHESGYETNAPIEIVNWTNEEGSRFAPAMLASGVFAGVYSRPTMRTVAKIATARNSEMNSIASATGAPRKPAGMRLARCSSFTSSKDRSWKTRARRSASLPACKACAGTR